MDTKSAKNGPNVKKKPEIQYYRPGQGISAKRPDTEAVAVPKSDQSDDTKQKTDNKTESKTPIESKSLNIANNNNGNKNNNKKPDIKVYVPPKLTTNGPNSSDKSGDKTYDKSNQRQPPLQSTDKPEKKSQNSKSDPNQHKSERNERRHRNERNNRSDRQERTERQERSDRHERAERQDRNEKFERNHRPEKSERHDRDRRERPNRSERPERHPEADRVHQNQTKIESESKHKTSTAEPTTESSSHFTKIKTNDQNKHKSRESPEVEVIRHRIPNVDHKLKHENRAEVYDTDYYNPEFGPNFAKDMPQKSQRHPKHNRNNSQSSSHGYNRSETSNENKSRNRAENSHRKYPANKGQHNSRYINTFEQQLPPRFLKQQQLKKKNELQNEEISETIADEPQSGQSFGNPSQSGETHPHRGLIRLPASNQTDWNLQTPQTDWNSPNKPANAGKPCVAIRPTQHVTAENPPPPQYSPSSSPDTNSLSTVDNYQQLSPYLRSNNYSEYAIPHFMATHENPDNSRKKLKAIIEKSLTEAMAAENDLLLCINDPQKFEQIRYRIQLRYEHIILNDLRVCAELNIEQRLWKSAFYQFIEHYRRLMEQNSEQQSELKTSLHKVIDEASLFFENLLVKMQETYGFVIEKFLGHEYDSDTENYDTLKLAAISAQKIYLYLGDLSRYRECETRNSNFVKSKFFYMRAQMLAPKNGRSYNQLAILANYQNRRLDAVYYYMRSLAASNPFLTARENLLAIFDEVRRKYELTEKKRKQDLMNQRKKLEDELKGLSSDKERLEIWIRADGTSAVCSNYRQLFEEDVETSKEDLDSLSPADLNKRFLLSFLHTHGKLFSRVGMETFIPVVNQMLAEFRSLLRRSPIPVMSQRLSQLLAINMFAVFNTSLKETSYGQNCRSLLQEQALQVTLAMISLILECATKLMEEQQRSQKSGELISDDLSELLPTIKLWTDWMSCQKPLWCPPPPPSDFNYRGDVWSIFAEFLTLLTKINVKSVKLLGSKLEGCEPIILPEDTNLSGFLPLMGAPQCIQFAQPFYDKEKAKICLRITAIQYFGDYLCGIVEPYLKYDVEKKRFVSLIPSSQPSVSSEGSTKTSTDWDNSETEIDDYSNDMNSVDSSQSLIIKDWNRDSDDIDMDIENLWTLQEKLKKAKDRQQVIKQAVDAVLSEENQRKPSRIIIQPRYIIPDTNCYIDHLDKIKRIIGSKLYDLIVPLIVINELQGLKVRGTKTSKPLTFSEDHTGNVGKTAAETIDYLLSAFNDKSLRLKAITSKGSLLDNINFTSESFADSQGNSNDDFILKACLHFIDDKPTDKNTKESALNSESNSIFREVVLLTDDRNLRVKALGRNVPVKGLKHFIKWANIPSEAKQS